MTLDEAIAKYNNLANNERTCYPEEAQQLAEWLEELKSYRASVFSGDMTQKMLKEEYNNAIDDFVNACKEDILCQTFGLHINGIESIAEQLKAGDRE